MYSRSRLAIDYLKYYFTAANGRGHGMHSPFIYELITRVLADKQAYEDYAAVENLRGRLLNDHRSIEVEDYGAGSGLDSSRTRKVSAIARNAAKPRKFGQLLYRLVRHYKPATIIELGTSLGLSTAYLSMGNTNATLISLEGASSIAGLARENLHALSITNATVVEGNFDQTLSSILTSRDRVDFVFVDGNHRQEPTLRYFNQLLEKIHGGSILVFDDIHWSREMELAWEEIKAHPRVRCTVDLFFIGLVFFREEFREKQDFKVRF